MFKFNLKPDIDKLAYTPKPERDWHYLFSGFIFVLILWAILHIIIFVTLEDIKNSPGPDLNQTTIDERGLNQALEVIEKRRVNFDSRSL